MLKNVVAELKFFPKKLQELLNASTLEKIQVGRVGDLILKYQSKEMTSYLKIGNPNAHQAEWKRLVAFSKTTITIPRILYYEETKDCSYLYITAVAGTPGHECHDWFSAEQTISLFAKALKEVHSVPVSSIDPSLSKPLAEDIRKYEQLVSEGKITSLGLDEDYPQSPKEAIGFLKEHFDLVKQDTVIHGDYCLPNILFTKDGTYGLIDWSYGSVSDKYLDFIMAEYSIETNFGKKKEYIDLFYKEYGFVRDEIYLIKLDYFTLVDAFINAAENTV